MSVCTRIVLTGPESESGQSTPARTEYEWQSADNTWTRYCYEAGRLGASEKARGLEHAEVASELCEMLGVELVLAVVREGEPEGEPA